MWLFFSKDLPESPLVDTNLSIGRLTHGPTWAHKQKSVTISVNILEEAVQQDEQTKATNQGWDDEKTDKIMDVSTDEDAIQVKDRCEWKQHVFYLFINLSELK